MAATIRTGTEGTALWRIVAGGILALAVSQGIGRFAFTPILPAMGAAFDLPTVVLGGLASANYLGYLLGAVVAAAVPARHVPRSVLPICLIVVVAVTGLMAVTTSVPVWFGLRFMAGVASAGVFVFASAIVLGQIGQRGRPDLAGAYFGGVGCGIALSGLVVLLVARQGEHGPQTWRVEWLAVSALAVVLSVPVLGWLDPDERAAAAPPPGRMAERRSRSRRLPLALLAGAYFLAGVGYIVAGTFLVAIVGAGDTAGATATDAATVAWIVAGLAAVPSALVWSWVARQLTLMAALGLAYLAQAVGLLLLTLGDAAWAPAAILFGGTFVGITSLTLTGGHGMVAADRATQAIAGLTALFGLGQVIGPLLAATLANDPGGLSRAMPVAAGVVLLGAGLVLAAGRLREAQLS